MEVCNFVDAGTSIALFAQAREDFHEQTAMEAVILFLRTYGRPCRMTFDRDPRSRCTVYRTRNHPSLRLLDLFDSVGEGSGVRCRDDRSGDVAVLPVADLGQ